MKRNKLTAILVATGVVLAGCGSSISSRIISESVTLGVESKETEDITDEDTAKDEIKELPKVKLNYNTFTYEENIGGRNVKYYPDNMTLEVLLMAEDAPAKYPTLRVVELTKEALLNFEEVDLESMDSTLVLPTWDKVDEKNYKVDIVLPANDGKTGYFVTVENYDWEGEVVEQLISDVIIFDTTVPEIGIAYNEESAGSVEEQAEYFNTDLEVELSVMDPEVLLENIKLTITKDGEIFDTTYQNKKVLSEDGVYEITLSVKDKGGHQVGLECPKRIVIDKTINKPEITLNGLSENGALLQKEAELKLEFVDENILETNVQILQSTISNPAVDVTSKVGLSEDSKGKCISFNASFPRGKEWEGTYKVYATIKDKAGNYEEKEMEFTLDRFGSSFSYGSYLSSVLEGNALFQMLEDDLIIEEVNPGKIRDEKTKILLTRDGKPVLDVNYTAQTTTVNSWWKNSYIISKENFTGDGIYKLTLVTEDMASNIGELSPEENKEIIFKVDRTAPDIQRFNWKRENSNIMLSCRLFDTFGISQIRIYKNEKLIDIVTEEDMEETELDKTFAIPDNNEEMDIKVVAVDFAGNETEKSDHILPNVLEDEVLKEDVIIQVDGVTPTINDEPSFPIAILISGVLMVFCGVFFILKKSL